MSSDQQQFSMSDKRIADVPVFGLLSFFFFFASLHVGLCSSFQAAVIYIVDIITSSAEWSITDPSAIFWSTCFLRVVTPVVYYV